MLVSVEDQGLRAIIGIIPLQTNRWLCAGAVGIPSLEHRHRWEECGTEQWQCLSGHTLF